MASNDERRELELLEILDSNPPPRVELKALTALDTIQTKRHRQESRLNVMAGLSFKPEPAPAATTDFPPEVVQQQAQVALETERMALLSSYVPAPNEVRFLPEEAPKASVEVSLNEALAAIEAEFSKQPQIREAPRMDTVERAAAFATGVVSGIVGGVEPDAFGSPIEKAIYKYKGRTPELKIGEVVGSVAPLAFTGVPARMIATGLGRVAPSLPNVFLRGVEAFGSGASLASARQGMDLLSGKSEKFDLAELGKEGALFFAADLLLRGGVRTYRQLIPAKPKPFGSGVTDKLISYIESTQDPKRNISVPSDFKTYDAFKDVRPGIGGGITPTIPLIQEMDGALSIKAKKLLHDKAGPLERYVLWRNEDYIKMAIEFTEAERTNLLKIVGDLSKAERKTLSGILNYIDERDAIRPVSELMKWGNIKALTKDPNLVQRAQETRKWLERMLGTMNRVRETLGVKAIAHRRYYGPHQLREVSLWAEGYGVGKTVSDITRKPGLPDFIRPSKGWNPHALAREANLPEYLRETDMAVVLERYLNAVTRDIFYTPIIRNNKAFARALENRGFANSARSLDDYTAEVFAGVRPKGDKFLFGAAGRPGKILERSLHRFRRGLVLGVFPGNLAWNLVVQPSSAVLTITRYGIRDSVRGLFDWYTKPELRRRIAENSYSFIVKNSKAGKVTRQDINRGVARALALERRPLETVADAMNFFTETIERNLTGWSVATGLRHGQRRGLTGEALWRFGSHAGAKTQSMYNRENLPGILRNESVKSIAPFQTFNFEVFTAMREFAGRTGTPPSDAIERIKWILRFLGAATAFNIAGQKTTGRQPWEIRSAIPFYQFLEVVPAAMRGERLTAGRGMPAPVGALTQFAQGTKDVIKSGNWRRLRTTSIRYFPGLVGIPGGVQASRLVDGWIAISEGGLYDGAGRLMFPIYDHKDELRSLFSGPWSTQEGRQYWRERSGLGDKPETFAGEVIEAIPGVKEVKETISRLKPE